MLMFYLLSVVVYVIGVILTLIRTLIIWEKNPQSKDSKEEDITNEGKFIYIRLIMLGIIPIINITIAIVLLWCSVIMDADRFLKLTRSK